MSGLPGGINGNAGAAASDEDRRTDACKGGADEH